MRYWVMPCDNVEGYKILFSALEDIQCSVKQYGKYDTEQEAIEKCAKLNAMLYPQPYIFVER